MRLLLAGIFLAIFGTVLLRADPAPVSEWQKVRDKQPAGLVLKMTLTKDHFYLGEKIEAKIEFEGGDGDKGFAMMSGNKEWRASFYATDEKGADVDEVGNPYSRFWRVPYDPDGPNTRIYTEGRDGPVSIYVSSHVSTTQSVSDVLSFDRPGVYSLYARTNVERGDSGDSGELVSERKTITILPLTDEEKAMIAAALEKIGRGPVLNDTVREGMTELSYLPTRAARDALISLMNRPELVALARTGLFRAPVPSEEAGYILNAVKSGKLFLNKEGVSLYGELKASHPYRDWIKNDDVSEEELRKYENEEEKTFKEGKDEVLAAEVKATGDKGPAHVEALWGVFWEMVCYESVGSKDSDGKARAALVPYQLELSTDHVKQLLDAWDVVGGEEFLPVVRRAAAANDFRGMIALADLRPDEARPMIVKELGLPDSRFFQENYRATDTLSTIKPLPLPECDAFFRAKLEKAKTDSSTWVDESPVIPVICTFGSPALLPNLLKAYDEYGKDNWDWNFERCFFRYWMRNDSKAGVAGLEKFLPKVGSTQESGFLMSGLFDYPWMNEGLPFVRKMLESTDWSEMEMGVGMADEHGDDSFIEPAIAALERDVQKNGKNFSRTTELAADLLASKRWHYTAAQKKRLETLAVLPTDK